MDNAERERWERLSLDWELVTAEIDERCAAAGKMLESSATTADLHAVRELQGQLKGLRIAANVVPQKLREIAEEDKRGRRAR